MDLSSSQPNYNNPELVSETTANSLLTEAGRRVDTLAPPTPEGKERAANLQATSSYGEHTIHIRQTPIELSKDGSTFFIHVYPKVSSEEGGSDHWFYYPNEKGGEWIKTTPPRAPEADVEDIWSESEGTPEGLIDAVGKYARSIRDQERKAGLSAVYEHEAVELLNLIKSGTPYETERESRSMFKGFLSLLGLRRPR